LQQNNARKETQIALILSHLFPSVKSLASITPSKISKNQIDNTEDEP